MQIQYPGGADGQRTCVRLREKVGYGIGDFGFNLYWANISAFLLIFYTDVLAAAAVGTMFLVTRVLDAVTGVLTWTVPDFDDTGRLVWAYLTFCPMMLAYTVLSMPYSALSAMMTNDSQQRTTLIRFRFIAAFAGTMVNASRAPAQYPTATLAPTTAPHAAPAHPR